MAVTVSNGGGQLEIVSWLRRDRQIRFVASVCAPFARPDTLGEAPVEHHDLAEIPQDYVLALEVAVNDAPRMCVGDRVANANERGQKLDPFDGISVTGGSLFMIGPNGLAQSAALVRTAWCSTVRLPRRARRPARFRDAQAGP